MTGKGYYDKLIEKLKEKIPRRGNLASVLIDLLCLSKESVYRRLRGEVAFTFDEICLLVKHFDLSIDEILNDDYFARGTTDNESGALYEEYEDHIIGRYKALIDELKKDPTMEYNCATNMIPTIFLTNYELLLKFRLYKVISYEKNDHMSVPLRKINISDDLIDVQRDLTAVMYRIPVINMIWDCNVIRSMLSEIEYFYKTGTLDSEDVANLHNELLSLIAELEFIATRGTIADSNTISIYVSNINFEAVSSYLENRVGSTHMLRGDALAHTDSRPDQFGGKQKNWLMSLKRHSTLISQSAEIERIKFFKKQRQYVEELTHMV